MRGQHLVCLGGVVEFDEAIKKEPHLRQYIDRLKKETGRIPRFYERLTRELGDEPFVNIIYPAGEHVFVHIFIDKHIRRYEVIQPQLTQAERTKYGRILNAILENAPREEVPEDEKELEKTLLRLYEKSVKRTRLTFRDWGTKKVYVTDEEYVKFIYQLKRDIIGHALIQPLVDDWNLEDIHVVGTNEIGVVHKIFGPLITNLKFDNLQYLGEYLRNLSERIGHPVSVARPIADSVLPDGSRINIIYADDISIRGPSFTVRKFAAVPMSIMDLVKLGTISTEMAAYLWICLEYGMNIFFSGETASGKTTFLNACLPMIRPDLKILSAEDTPEVRPPHKIWQRLVTRTTGPEESRVDMFSILKAALRSRPNYIIVGEIRGVEGSVAFQAMQTGHSVLATFHAGSVRRLIQRLVGNPINIPITFMDNLHVVAILQAVYIKGRFQRRCISIEEIEGYSEEAGGVITKQMFEWDGSRDEHRFLGLHNSYILEEKIAPMAGYAEKRMVYIELEKRKRVLDAMYAKKIFDYDSVLKMFVRYYEEGIDSLPTV
ncbi:MAG: type II/IV secretion system ATPase subunit [Candidatus Micrarchaeia archaeon]